MNNVDLPRAPVSSATMYCPFGSQGCTYCTLLDMSSAHPTTKSSSSHYELKGTESNTDTKRTCFTSGISATRLVCWKALWQRNKYMHSPSIACDIINHTISDDITTVVAAIESI
jgi:hypothetical protein